MSINYSELREEFEKYISTRASKVVNRFDIDTFDREVMAKIKSISFIKTVILNGQEVPFSNISGIELFLEVSQYYNEKYRELADKFYTRVGH